MPVPELSIVLLGMNLLFPGAVLADMSATPIQLPDRSPPSKPAQMIERSAASSPYAPHIDSITLREERIAGRLYIDQQIAYHAEDGNARNLHFELVSVSRTPGKVRVRDHPIRSPAARQQAGTFILARFNCGPFDKNYSHVTRATIFAANGEHSNTVDFTVDCNLAAIS